jgi:hypothetical protein
VLEQTEREISVRLPKEYQQEPDTVVVLQLDGPAEKEMKDGNPL